MNKDPQKIFDHMKKVKLTNAEKSEMHTVLVKNIHENPIEAPSTKESPYFSGWTFLYKSKRLQYVMASLFLVIITGSSVTYAAEGALPGDILYPVKIKLNEPVARVLNSTNESKAIEFETRLVEKRLNEAEKLLGTKKLDRVKKEEIKTNIIVQTEKVEQRINKIIDKEEKEKRKVEKKNKSAKVAVEETTMMMSAPAEEQNGNNNDEDEKDENENEDGDHKESRRHIKEVKRIIEKHNRVIDELED